MGRKSRAVLAALLAAAMVMPTALANPPTGEPEHRSMSGATAAALFSTTGVSCLEVLDDGTVLTGLSGGGVAEWDATGGLRAFATTVEGLPSSDVRGLAVLDGSAVAATRAGVARRLGQGSWALLSDEALTSILPSATGLIALADDGSVHTSTDGISWSTLDVPGAGFEGVGWGVAAADGDMLALSDGTGIVMVNLTTMEDATVVLPLGGPSSGVNDLALSVGRLAVAFNDRPDVYDLSSKSWLASGVAATARSLDQNWSSVTIGTTVLAGSRYHGGVVATLDPGTGPADAAWDLLARVDGGGPVVDVRPRPGGGAYAAMSSGAWILLPDGTAHKLGEGTVSSIPWSAVEGAKIAGDLLWTVSRGYLHGLALDASGQPLEWTVVQDEELGFAHTLRDVAELASVVYFAVRGEAWSYDLYLSSKPSRWAALPFGDGPPDDRVYTVEVMGAALYAGGAFGVARLAPEREPTPWNILTGSPQDVWDLVVTETGLLAATDTGLWEMNATSSAWARPSDTGWLPSGIVTALAVSTGGIYAAVGSDIHWSGPSAGSLACGAAVIGLSSLPGTAFPVWAVLSDGGALAILPDDTAYSFGPTTVGVAAQDDALGDAVANAVATGPDGTAWLATDGGLHRIVRFGTSWSQWTTSNGLSANDIRTLAREPSSDRVWAGAYGGVDVLTAPTGAVEPIGTEQGLPSNLVYDIAMRSGDVWVATDAGGAARRALTGGQWTVYNMTTGLVADDVQAIAFIGTKAVFGTDSGVSVVDLVSSSISTHTMSSTAGALPSDWVWCELATVDRVWAGTQGGLAWYDPVADKWTRALADELAGREVRSLLADSRGRLWVGTSAGVLFLDVGTGEALELAGMSKRAALALMQDSKGDVWAGTESGAVLMDGEGRVKATFTTREGLVHDRVTSLAELPDGVIWFGTAGGLSRMELTDWHILPQWVMSTPELPDLGVSETGVSVSPARPSEGETVTVSVKVENPSALRAIGTVVLATTADPAPGEELASAIAYTEPGGNFTVALCWTATGGDHALWIVVDPEGRVPESDERNNAVAIGLKVNHVPVLRAPAYVLEKASASWHNDFGSDGTFTVEVTYKDLDGDPATVVRMGRVSPLSEGFDGSFNWTLRPVIPGGSIESGRLYRGTAYLSKGNTTLYIWATDGLASNWTDIFIPFNFNVSVSGIASGDQVGDRVRVDFAVVGPWEGTSVVNLTAWYYMENLTLGLPGWGEIPATRDGMSLTLDMRFVSEGTHTIYLVAFDDRGVYSRVVVEDVEVSHDGDSVGFGWVLILILIVLLVFVLVLVIIIRHVRRGNGK